MLKAGGALRTWRYKLKYLGLAAIALERSEERFSPSRWRGVRAVGKLSVLWKDRNCIGLSLSHAPPPSSVLFSSSQMPPGWTQEPMTSRWVSDPAAPGIFYFQAFVGVCGGQQWLERWPKTM